MISVVVQAMIILMLVVAKIGFMGRMVRIIFAEEMIMIWIICLVGMTMTFFMDEKVMLCSVRMMTTF